MISDAIALLELVRKVYGTYQDRKILSALFSWDAKRVEGDERITVKLHLGLEATTIGRISRRAQPRFQSTVSFAELVFAI